MDLITLDMETYYDRNYSLSKMSTEEYVRSDLFETLIVSLKINGDVPIYACGSNIEKLLHNVNWGKSVLLAQNTAFDASILAWRYNIRPAKLADTMAMSRALYPHAKSHSLKAQAERMGVGVKGDEVLNALGKRLQDFSEEELSAYIRYCTNDVELTYNLFNLYMQGGFPAEELPLVDMTLRMFVEPVLRLDTAVLKKHLHDVRAAKAELRQRVLDMGVLDIDTEELGESTKKALMSPVKFAAVLHSMGVEVPMKISPTTGQPTYAFAKTDEEFVALQEHPDPQVQALVAARLGERSTIEETRTEALLAASLRGPLPIALRYYGALTGRWSAEGGLNWQNVPRHSLIKAAVLPPPGYVMLGADLSNIELRLGLWMAGQDDKLAMLAAGRDLYKDFASLVFNVAYEDIAKEQRQVGKIAMLSLIYGTGAAKLRDALRVTGKISMPLEEVTPIVEMYRTVYDRVRAAWKQGDRALHAVAGDTYMPLFANEVCVVEGRKGIRLPSGLYLQYPGLRKVASETGSQWVYDGKHGEERVYGAKVFQACDQAVARCVIAIGMQRIQKKYPVRISIHDAAYWVAKEEEADEALAYGIKCLTDPVPYCPGLPLAAEGAFGATLKDC